jgi:hypothetical protein
MHFSKIFFTLFFGLLTLGVQAQTPESQPKPTRDPTSIDEGWDFLHIFRAHAFVDVGRCEMARTAFSWNITETETRIAQDEQFLFSMRQMYNVMGMGSQYQPDPVIVARINRMKAAVSAARTAMISLELSYDNADQVLEDAMDAPMEGFFWLNDYRIKKQGYLTAELLFEILARQYVDASNALLRSWNP